MFLFDDALLAALLSASLAPEAAGAAAIGSLATGGGMALAGTGGGLALDAALGGLGGFGAGLANGGLLTALDPTAMASLDVAPGLGTEPVETFGMFDRSLGTQPTTWDKIIGYGKKGMDTLSSPKGLLAMNMMGSDSGQQRPVPIQRPPADSGPVQIAPRFNNQQQPQLGGNAYEESMRRYLMRRKFGMGA